MPASKQADHDLARSMAMDCIAVRVRRLHRVVSRIYDDALRPHGLTTAQLNLLVAITALDSVSPTALCERLDLEKSTVSRNVERMAREGWVLAQTAEDGRERLLSTTRQGRSLLRRVRSDWDAAQKRAKKLLGRDGTRGLFQAADALP